MMPRLLLISLFAVLLLAAAGLAGEERILYGTYRSDYQDRPQRMRVLFKPVEQEQGAWLVSFDFTYGKRSYTYSGTARGSFEEGEIGGLVENESGARSFTFFLQERKGNFSGTHAEVIGGSEEPTGTLTLKEKSKKKPK